MRWVPFLISALEFIVVAKLATNPSLASTRLPTRVTGHGSRKRATIDSRGEAKNSPLRIFSDPVDESVRVRSTLLNCTISICPGGNVREEPDPALNQSQAKSLDYMTWTPVEGIFGVYNVPSGRLWVFVATSDPVYEAPLIQTEGTAQASKWWEIRKVRQLHILHVSGTTSSSPLRVPQRQVKEEEHRQLSLLRHALKSHDWYFCCQSGTVTDFTSRLQVCLQEMNNGTVRDSEPWWAINSTTAHPDSRFFWNEMEVEPILQSYLQHCNSDKSSGNPYQTLLRHVIPVTSAFVAHCKVSSALNGDQSNATIIYDQILISRRSRFRAGTRFTMRGADATGAVANYVETEQIVLLWQNDTATGERVLDQVLSHVQTRGSIPLRWSSPTDIKTYRPRVRIGINPIAQARAVQKHLEDQMSRYVVPHPRGWAAPGLVFLNLVDKKSDQGRLGRAWNEVLNAVLDVFTETPDPEFSGIHNDAVQHFWFDFHAEVKSGRWHRLNSLLDEIKLPLMEHGYFSFKPIATEPTQFDINRVQSGVIRTNCMDCLDRTNVVQSIIGRYMLCRQIVDNSPFKIPLSMKTRMSVNPLEIPWKDAEKAHRLLWADNADSISRLYAGTAALKGDFTRTGKRTKRGAIDDGMNSLQRYYLNNFMDADRQEGLDLLTGYQSFSGVLDETSEEDQPAPCMTSLSLDKSAKRSSYLDIREAARRVIEGSAVDRSDEDQDGDHVRIKQEKVPPQGSHGNHLELRWLPGDLRSHVRSLAHSSAEAVRAASAPIDYYSNSLNDVERRLSTPNPWWVAEEAEESEEDKMAGDEDVEE